MPQERKVSWKELLHREVANKQDEIESICIYAPRVIDDDGFYDAKEDRRIFFVDDSHKEMSRAFDPGYGSPEGTPFYAWGKKFVYFAACYDGAEWVASVPRNPTDKVAPEHIGGG